MLSRNHAELFVQGDDIAVRDLGSSNGTFLNDSRITDEPVVLRTGDVLDFGIDVQDDDSDLVPRTCSADDLARAAQCSLRVLAAQQARVSVLVHIPADGDSLPDVDVDIISAPAAPLTAHLQLDDVTRKLKVRASGASAQSTMLTFCTQTQLLEEEERSEVLHSLLQLVDGISTYKHSYILVAKELQVKDERISELSRLSSEQQETIATLRAVRRARRLALYREPWARCSHHRIECCSKRRSCRPPRPKPASCESSLSSATQSTATSFARLSSCKRRRPFTEATGARKSPPSERAHG